MAEADFLGAITDREIGTGGTFDIVMTGFYQDFLDACDTRIGEYAGDTRADSPARKKLEAIRQRVRERLNEVNPKGAGLQGIGEDPSP